MAYASIIAAVIAALATTGAAAAGSAAQQKASGMAAVADQGQAGYDATGKYTPVATRFGTPEPSAPNAGQALGLPPAPTQPMMMSPGAYGTGQPLSTRPPVPLAPMSQPLSALTPGMEQTMQAPWLAGVSQQTIEPPGSPQPPELRLGEVTGQPSTGQGTSGMSGVLKDANMAVNIGTNLGQLLQMAQQAQQPMLRTMPPAAGGNFMPTAGQFQLNAPRLQGMQPGGQTMDPRLLALLQRQRLGSIYG